MDLQITPQPNEEERAAIEAALGQEPREVASSPWTARVLPQRDGDPEQP